MPGLPLETREHRSSGAQVAVRVGRFASGEPALLCGRGDCPYYREQSLLPFVAGEGVGHCVLADLSIVDGCIALALDECDRRGLTLDDALAYEKQRERLRIADAQDGRRCTLYCPSDIDDAHEEWGANCGPIAVAALLGREVNAVRELFEPWPGYTNPTLIRRAIERAGRCSSTGNESEVRNGLGFVQFEGPWERGGARAAYRHTHWVALARRPWLDTGRDALMVYDAAAGDSGGWVQIGAFSALVVPQYLQDEPKATGWRFRSVLEVEEA